MPAALPVIVNRSGGAAAALGEGLAEAIHTAFADVGRAIALELVDGDALRAAVARHAGKPVVAVGGGDGSLGAAAGSLAHTDSALAILPLGTRNHLARQLTIPLDLPGAAALAVTGGRRMIDLGSVARRVFVNNASLGLYVQLMRARERRRGPKWLKTLAAMIWVLRRFRAQRFALRIDGRPRPLETPLLFIGNNRYSLKGGRLGQRASLGEGMLSLCALAAQHPAGLAAVALRAALGRTRPRRDFEELATARRIELMGEGRVELALDGEALTLPLPLTFRSLHCALRVVAPPG